MPEKRVVIDIGHGFYDQTSASHERWDPGAVEPYNNQDIEEFELNMIAAIACQGQLQVRGHWAGFVPFGLPLVERGKCAAGMDVFLSIHHNASEKHLAQGSEVAVHKTRATAADSALAGRVAKKVSEALGIPNRGIVGMNLAVLRGARETNVKAAVLTEGFFLDRLGDDIRSMARRSGLAIADEVDRWLKEGN